MRLVAAALALVWAARAPSGQACCERRYEAEDRCCPGSGPETPPAPLDCCLEPAPSAEAELPAGGNPPRQPAELPLPWIAVQSPPPIEVVAAFREFESGPPFYLLYEVLLI